MARDTLGAAGHVAGQLPDQVGHALLAVAGHAFVQGLHLAAGISAAVALAGAVFSVALLRSVSTSAAPAAPAIPEDQSGPPVVPLDLPDLAGVTDRRGRRSESRAA
jgi:DHA2 family multidrug resistance protein-like MFS transporter